MSDQSDSTAKKATKVKSPTQNELKRSQDLIRQQNKVKRTNKGGRNNTSVDITTETILFSPPSTSSNPGKTFKVPRDENILIVQSGEGQSYKKKIDDVIHPNIHLDHNDISGSSTPVLSATEGSLSHPMDDESKQMHANSLDVKVSNNQFLKDSLPVIEHAGSSGEGLPYAPENWPSPGDVWTWRVGKRYTHAGFWQDRSVHPPNSLRSSTCNKMSFNSRVSLEQYIRNTFPDADVDAFFASFIWKIPCTNAAKEIANAYASPLLIKSNGCSKAAAAVRSGDCRASNEMCSVKAKTSSSLTPATCYICCTEPNFCRYCCCILCSKTIDWIYDGYNFIKCEAPIDEKFICGHVAHIECALHAYMAGKVGGSSDLDAQYYCRCCDNKTDLLLHVDKIIKVCESIDNKDDKGKVLNLGLCILRGSEKETAKKLRNHITMLIEKLKQGASLEICKKKSEISESVQDKDEGEAYLTGLMKYIQKGGSHQSQGSSDSASRPSCASRSRETSPHKSEKRRRRSRSPSTRRERFDEKKRSKHHHHKDQSYTSSQSYPDSSRHGESLITLLDHPTSTHMGSYSIPSTAAGASQSVMAPLSGTIPMHADHPASQQPGSIPLRPLPPLNTTSLDAAIKYATSAKNWMTTASFNLGLLTSKYEFAKHHIENDGRRINELSVFLQKTKENLKDVSEERTRLSNSLTHQCGIVTKV